MLDRLVEKGVLQKTDYSDWAAPIVPVPKSDGSIRICGDYKVTINPALPVDQYPIQRPNDLFTCLTGGKLFTKLDLKAAYQQMLLDESSSEMVTCQEKNCPPEKFYPRTKIFSDCVENFCPTLKIFVHPAKSCLPDFLSALHVSYCIVAH